MHHTFNPLATVLVILTIIAWTLSLTYILTAFPSLPLGLIQLLVPSE